MGVLQDKIKNKTAVLGVIGLGYVGLPLAVEKAKSGFFTYGFDVEQKKIDKVNKGENYIKDIDDEELKDVVQQGLLKATNDFSLMDQVDVMCICVSTPLDDHQVPDISFVHAAAMTISEHLHKDMMIILESTTYPGTTRELLQPIFEKSGLICGKDFYLAFSPERVDPGNTVFKTKNTPKVVGGITPDCTENAAILYEMVLDAPIHRVSSPDVAEMEKILENTFRNVNIGLVNELAVLCDDMGIDIWEVVDAASTKPYGFTPFYPGPGLGGHCIPLDPYYLSWKAKEYGFHTTMIESSMVVNDRMPKYVVERVFRILNTMKRSVNGSKILMLGVAYKKDIDDYRESPALKVFDFLEQEGACIDFFDPYVEEYVFKGKKRERIESIDPDVIASYDLVLIATAHTNIDYEMISKNAKMIFDTRNAMSMIQKRDNIVLL